MVDGFLDEVDCLLLDDGGVFLSFLVVAEVVVDLGSFVVCGVVVVVDDNLRAVS